MQVQNQPPERKSFQGYSVKVVDQPQGIIEAVVSVFGNVDSAGERILPGAFTQSLIQKSPKGVWMHQWDQPIAKTIEARELLPGDPLLPEEIRLLGGLYIKGQFNLGTQRGRDAFSDVVFGVVDEFSIGYSVTKQSANKEMGCVDLLELKLYEWSPVLIGCNPATQLVSAKDLGDAVAHEADVEVKAGATFSASNKGTIKAAIANAQEIVAKLTAMLGDEEESKGIAMEGDQSSQSVMSNDAPPLSDLKECAADDVQIKARQGYNKMLNSMTLQSQDR